MPYRAPGMKTRKILRRFLRDESGMTLPTLALSFMAMAGFVGSAVDIGRIQLVQSRLSFALDAAGLAAGSTMNTSNISAELTKYMNANYPAGYLGSTAPTISATVSNNNMVITLGASTTVPTTFMRLFGIKTTTVTATAEITRTATGLELALVLDNTGSMSSNGKLTALKTAATNLVNILFGGKETQPNLWVGLVPFAQAVNIGSTRNAWLDATHFATLNWGPTSWGGCVDARETNNRDVTDDPPSVQTFKAYYWPSDGNNYWITGYSPLTYASGIGVNKGPNKDCSQVLTPLTASSTTLKNAVNAMQAQGNTHIVLGLAWGWRLLSPKWQGLWGGEMNANGLPLAYGTPKMNKAVVLLTDGENTMSNSARGGYWYLSDGHLGTTSSSTAVTQLNNRMMTVCNSLKNNGVYVYTIALGNPGTSIQNLLKSCATAENYYFNSPTGADLQNAFSAIADSLSNLRISR